MTTTDGRVLVIDRKRQKHLVHPDGTNQAGVYHHGSLYATSDGQRYGAPIWVHYVHDDLLKCIDVPREWVDAADARE